MALRTACENRVALSKGVIDVRDDDEGHSPLDLVKFKRRTEEAAADLTRTAQVRTAAVASALGDVSDDDGSSWSDTPIRDLAASGDANLKTVMSEINDIDRQSPSARVLSTATSRQVRFGAVVSSNVSFPSTGSLMMFGVALDEYDKENPTRYAVDNSLGTRQRM